MSFRKELEMRLFLLSSPLKMRLYAQENGRPIHELVCRALSLHGVSLADVAWRASVDPSLPSKVLRGQRRNVAVLRVAATALGWSVTDLREILGLEDRKGTGQ